MASEPDRPIIVLGCPRSGTTLLQLMLHAHPRIAIPPETRFLLDAYRQRREFGDLRQAANREKLARWIVSPKGRRFGDLGLDAQACVEQIVAGPPTLGSALGIVFRAYADRFGKVRWGDKRPGYYQYTGELLRLFPDAQIVHLIRDGRDCVGSLKQMPWYRHDSYHAVATWAEAVDYGRAASAHLSPDRFYEMRYEELVADPQEQLARLCAFLGEDFHPAMCEPAAVAEVAVPARKTWHSGTRGELTAAAAGSWRRRLEPWEAGLCETVLGSRLSAYGYELSGTHGSGPGNLAHYARVAARRRLARRKRMAYDRLYRLHEPTPEIAARLK